MLKLVLTQGDVLPVPFFVLTDVAGNPLQLSVVGTSLRFRMVNVHTGVVQVDAEGKIVQNDDDPTTYGQVAYLWERQDTVVSGLYQAWFITDMGNGPQHFPPDGSFYVLIKKAR